MDVLLFSTSPGANSIAQGSHRVAPVQEKENRTSPPDGGGKVHSIGEHEMGEIIENIICYRHLASVHPMCHFLKIVGHDALISQLTHEL